MNPSQMSAQSHPGHLRACCCITVGKLLHHPRCGGLRQHSSLLPESPTLLHHSPSFQHHPPSFITHLLQHHPPSSQHHPPSLSEHFPPDKADFPCTTGFVLLPCSLSTQRSSQDIFCLLLFITMFAKVQALQSCYSWSALCCQTDRALERHGQLPGKRQG